MLVNVGRVVARRCEAVFREDGCGVGRDGLTEGE